MGSYPTVVDWNNDSKHDLLVGDADGNVLIYLNSADNINPEFTSGSTVIASDGSFDYYRAAPIISDWNGDGKKDLLVGHMDGKIQVYINGGTDADPVFTSSSNIQVGGNEFDIGSRSAPRVYDWNHDGLQDLMVGELSGNIYYLENVGTNAIPLFDSYEMLLLANGSPLKYDSVNNPSGSPRSRIFVTDWNEDGLDDIIVGGADGKLELYTTVVPEPVSSTLFIIGGAAFGIRHLRRKIHRRAE